MSIVKKPVVAAKAASEDKEAKALISGLLSSKNTKNLPKVQHLDQDEDDFIKIMVFGEPGAGKTKALEGFLHEGLKVCGITTDLGGSGLATVKRSLLEQNRRDLLGRIKNIDLANFEQVELFLDNPEKVYPEIWEFDPDLLFWEGYSFFQTVTLDEYVLETDAIGKEENVPELRKAGLFALQPDWNALRRGAMRYMHKFLVLHNRQTGKRLHKYVTFQEDLPEKDDKGKELAVYKKKPLLYTNANVLVRAGFDLVIQMAKLEGSGGKVEYKYRTQSSPTLYAKNRHLPVDPEEPADMQLLWRKIASSLKTAA